MEIPRKFGFLFLFGFLLYSFHQPMEKKFQFVYPGREHTAFSIESGNFTKFKEEKQGTDYYYFGTGKDGMILSVLYYKLNEEEQLGLVDLPRLQLKGPETSPAYPFTYFSTYNNLKPFEKNESSWGEPQDDFMFRQADVPTVEGRKINQKHMYAYFMPDKDLFVSVHLSKVNSTPADSVSMRKILLTLSLQ
jgi:hypothetical protein